MATAQQANTTQAQISTINPNQIQKPTAANAQPGQVGTTALYDATTGTAASAGQAKLGSTSTVQGLLGNIMSQDNPLMQQARTQSQQQMAGRGLLNSSMAVGAGQQALYGVAMPIAQSDAAAHNNMSQFNAGAQNNMSQFNAGNQQQMSLANLQAQNTASSQNAQAYNQNAQFNAGNVQQANLTNAGAQNNMSQFNATNQYNALQQNMQAQNAGSQFNANQSNAQSQFNAGQSNELLKAELEFANRKELGDIEASYKTLMQANQSAGELYQQTIKNIADISKDPDMDAATKQSRINNQMSYLKTGMSLYEKLNNIQGLAQLIQF